MTRAYKMITIFHYFPGPVDKLLSWKFFMPLSRLTYTSYLVHPMVLFYTYTSRETELHIDMYSMAILYMGELKMIMSFEAVSSSGFHLHDVKSGSFSCRFEYSVLNFTEHNSIA